MIDFAAILVLTGAIAALASLVALHVAPTGLSPVRNPVSEYALTRFRAGYVVAALTAAVAGAGAAFLLAPLAGSTPAVVLLIVFAVSRALIPLVPMDAPGAARTRRGRAHNLLAVAAFATVTAAAFLAAGPLADAGYAALSTASTVAGIVMAAGSAGVLFALASAPARAIFGFVERLIYVGLLGWFIALGVGVLIG